MFGFNFIVLLILNLNVVATFVFSYSRRANVLFVFVNCLFCCCVLLCCGLWFEFVVKLLLIVLMICV